MGYLLKYCFHSGQQLTYRHATYMSLAEPGQERLFGHMLYRRWQRCLKAQGEDYEMEFGQECLKRDGPLVEYAPVQDGPAVRILMATNGQLKGSAEIKAPTFPSHELEEGDNWEVVDNAMNLVFVVEKFEELAGEVVATIASTGQSLSQENGEAVELEIGSRFTFNLTRGCQLESHSLITQRWASGRLVETLVESSLEEP